MQFYSLLLFRSRNAVNVEGQGRTELFATVFVLPMRPAKIQTPIHLSGQLPFVEVLVIATDNPEERMFHAF